MGALEGKQDRRLLDAVMYATTFGFKMFPAIYKDGKHIGLVKWGKESSSDPEVLRQWASKYPNAYFCINTKASCIRVVDIDNKKGKEGTVALFENSVLYGDGNANFAPLTLTSESPSGGLHHFFYDDEGDCQIGVNKFGIGVDSPVMVPVPGSIVNGKGEYKSHDKFKAIAKLPKWLTEVSNLNTNTSAKSDLKEAIEDLDKPHHIEQAKDYLENKAPLAYEGDNGDATTFKVCCWVRDLGITSDTCLDLMADHWNERCEPPWDISELKTKIDNAYRYAKEPAGSKTAEADFKASGISDDSLAEQVRKLKESLGYIEPDEQEETEPTKKTPGFRSISSILSEGVPRPEWTVKHFQEKGTVSVWFGDSGSLKSFLVMNMGLHVAMGKPWAGKKVSQGSVFYLAGEGHGGLARRLFAHRNHHPEDRKDMEKAPFFINDRQVSLATKKDANLIIKDIKSMVEEHGAPELVIIDTLAATFGGGDENSTQDMVEYVSSVMKLKTDLKCSVIIVHHTGKANKDNLRGSYSLHAGVDNVFRVVRDDIVTDDRDTEKMRVILESPIKLKDGRPPADTSFLATEVNLGVDEDMEEITSLALDHDIEFNPKDRGPSGDNKKKGSKKQNNNSGHAPVKTKKEKIRDEIIDQIRGGGNVGVQKSDIVAYFKDKEGMLEIDIGEILCSIVTEGIAHYNKEKEEFKRIVDKEDLESVAETFFNSQ